VVQLHLLCSGCSLIKTKNLAKSNSLIDARYEDGQINRFRHKVLRAICDAIGGRGANRRDLQAPMNMKLFIMYFVLGAAVSISVSNKVCASPVDDFASKYKKAKTEVQKRTVCIQLIDAGLLYSGSPIDDVKKVFQGDFEEKGADGKDHRLAVVHFVPPKRPLKLPNQPMGQAEVIGWYLSVTYRDDGTVVHYCLSNESITTSMQLMYERQLKQHRSNSGTGLPSVTNMVNDINRSANTN
jgi:hypothetical protein